MILDIAITAQSVAALGLIVAFTLVGLCQAALLMPVAILIQGRVADTSIISLIKFFASFLTSSILL